MQQAGKFLGISERQVRYLVAEKELPHLYVGKLLKFRPDSLREWVKKEETPSKLKLRSKLTDMPMEEGDQDAQGRAPS